MGTLHIEIIKDRLLKEYGIEVYLGPLQIAYRETITESGSATYTLDQFIGKVQLFWHIVPYNDVLLTLCTISCCQTDSPIHC